MKSFRIVPVSLFLMALLVAGIPAGAQTAGTTDVYQGGEVENGGTISGKVVWKGTKPNLESFEINKNPEVCDVDGSQKRPSNRLVISDSGGVANAVVYLEEVQQGKPLPTEGAKLDQKGCQYVPHVTIVPRRAQLTLSSGDSILHNIHMFDAASYNIPFPDMNVVVKRMRKSGVVRVQCDAGHGWMNAYVFVVDHPYYAVTGENGEYTLTDVPPGKYSVKTWHENWVVKNKIEKEGVITGYEFGEPIEQTKEIEVSSGGTASLDFELSQ